MKTLVSQNTTQLSIARGTQQVKRSFLLYFISTLQRSKDNDRGGKGLMTALRDLMAASTARMKAFNYSLYAQENDFSIRLDA